MTKADSKNRAKNPAGGSDRPSAECPVEVFGRELAALRAREDKLDKIHSKIFEDAQASHPVEAIQRFCVERRIQIEDAISALRPQGLPGAIVSLVLASARIDLIKSDIPKIEDADAKLQMDRDFRHLNALMYGVLGALRAGAPGIYEAVAGDFYMPECRDPSQAISVADTQIEVRAAA